MESRYGVSLGYRDDFIREGTDYVEGQYEMLVGETNRKESIEVCDELKKYDDYEVRMCGDKLVIAGKNDKQLAAAVRTLKEAIAALPENSDYFFDENMQFSFRGTYEIEEMMIGDTEISEYTIVYKNGEVCEKLAATLAERIVERTGYMLDTVVDTTASADSKKILVGNTRFGNPHTEEADGYYVGNDASNVYLYAQTEQGVYKAVTYLTGLIDSAVGQTVTLDLNIGFVISEDTSMTSMSFNLLVSNVTTERKARVISMIEKYMPDTLGVQEASETWISTLESELGDTYANVGTGRDAGGSGERSSVFYKKDKFNLKDSGTKWMSSTPDKVSKVDGSICNRVFSYALLERKSDGKRFMHINVHTDHATDDAIRLAQVKVLMEFVNAQKGVAIIMSGDFNSTVGTSSISHILDAGVENASSVALDGDDSPTFKSIIIDFFFVTKGDFVVYKYWVDMSKIDGEYPSDHYPILVTYDIK